MNLLHPNAGPADDATAKIEAFVAALTPAVTNSTHAYNLWNLLASDDGDMRRALEWAWKLRDDHRAGKKGDS